MHLKKKSFGNIFKNLYKNKKSINENNSQKEDSKVSGSEEYA